MKWLKNLTIGPKLIIGFSVMIAFMAIIGLTGYRSTRNIQRNLNDIFTVNLSSIDYLIEADRDLQQLLVAERSMIFTNANSDMFKGFVGEYEENLRQSEEAWQKYRGIARTAEELAIVPQYEKAWLGWKDISRKVVDGRKSDTRAGRRLALDLSLGRAKEEFELMRDYLNQLTVINLNIAKEAHSGAAVTYRNTITTIFGAMGAGLLVGILLMWLLGRGVTEPLKAIIKRLTNASDQVASASSQVSSSSQSLAEGASEQAASLEETSSSLEEMSSMTRQNADNATHADSLMKEANQTVEKANISMGELTTSMDEISQASEDTQKIIKTIDEIAFQTNLLALNAAVEAARAGEAGAGFAVVADEVRNLAMRAADAAGNTAELIEGTVKRIKDGSGLVTKTNEAFTEVSEISSKVGELVGEIAAASNEQTQGIEQINTAVSQMDKITQQNAANAEESASASEQMSAQAEQMKEVVGELVALVGGNGNKIGAKDYTVSSRGMTGNRKIGANINKYLSPPGKKVAKEETKPEKVIPLDEDDFKDF